LLEVFLEEAREVVVNGLAVIDVLQEEPGNLSEQTTLRRAFHTLKGSSRMVGLNDYGEAAWSMEQVLNAWLAEQKPMQPGLLQLSSDALTAFGRWADDIAAGQASGWQPEVFRRSADAMRTDGVLLPLDGASGVAVDAPAEEPAAPVLDAAAAPEAPALEPVVAVTAEAPEAAAEELAVPDFVTTEISDEVPVPSAETVAPAAQTPEEIDF